MANLLKIAGVQMTPVILEKERNLSVCIEGARKAAASGVKLVIFPETALPGYCFASLQEAVPVAETVPGPSTERLISLCRELNVYIIVGLLEKDGDRYYNAAVFLGPKGVVGKYRKLHLPFLGIDRFVNHGNLPLAVYDTDIGKIGMGICYDLAFPEQSRVMALEGAELIVNITAWPGTTTDPNFVRLVHVRAYENAVNYVSVNRVGVERGWHFFGNSVAVDPAGRTMAQARQNEEDVLLAEFDLSLSNRKHQIVVPGELEIDRVRDRRPEMYGEIVKPLQDKSRIR
jgi:predicted amidohydrolase